MTVLMRAAVAASVVLSLVGVPGRARADGSAGPPVTGVSAVPISPTGPGGTYNEVQVSWTNPLSVSPMFVGITIVQKPGGIAPASENESGTVKTHLNTGYTTSFTTAELPEAGMHSYSVFADYDNSTASAPASVTVDSVTVLAATQNTFVDYGKSAKITGNVYDTAKRTGIDGGTLQLLAYPLGNNSSGASAGTVTINSGAYSTTFAPGQSYRFVLLYPGDATHIAGVSAPVEVDVNPLLELVFPKKHVHGKKFAVGMGMAPNPAGQSVQLQRQSGGKWQKVGTATTDKNGAAAMFVKETREGTYYYRAYAPGNDYHRPGYSAKVKVKVS